VSIGFAEKFDSDLGEQIDRFARKSLRRHVEVVGRQFHANAIAAPLRGGDAGRARTHERVQDRISGKAEHPYEALG
jgi:predicted transcriptional regulator